MLNWRRSKPEHRKVEDPQAVAALLGLPENERLPEHIEGYLALARGEMAGEDADELARYA